MGGSVALLMAASVAAYAQELLPVFPGVTTLGARVVPSPVGVSPEMTKIITARQIPPDIPVPATTQEWLKQQGAL